LHKNGHFVHIELKGSNQLYNPLIKAMLITCRDITERKTAEQAIADSYKKLEDYKFAIDQSNTVFIMDDAGVYLYVNDNFCKLTKYTREDVIGQSRVTLASGYHNESFFNAMWQTIRSGKVWRSHVKGRAKDGSYFWVEATITPFMDGTGKPYQYLSINTDISQTKLAEEALATSNERFQYVTQATFDAIWDWDIANKTIFWGDGYKTLFGYEPGLHTITRNQGFSVFIHPDERRKVLTSIYDTIDSGASYWSQGYRYRKADGEYAYVVDKAIIIRDEQGYAIRMIGAMQDNTERRMAAEELKKSELKFRSMVYNITDVITLLDENGFVLYCSPSLTAVLGYAPEEVIGLKMFSLMHPDDYARSKEVFKNLMTTKGNGGIIEAKYKHKNGHYLTVESQGNNQLHNPAINAVVLTTRDTTKRKEKEEEKLQLVYELMEKNADLKQFSYITSHNLRAPLTNLMAICTLLDTENISQEDTHELINAFKTSTIKLNDTLNDLIKILIIKDGRSQEIETVYFHKTLNEVKASIAGMIEASRAVIHADFSAAASVNFYSIYMESILLNLLTNSLKYAYPGRKPVIAMQTRVEEKFVVFTFMDNGMGMNMQKVRSKIFGLYQRFHTNIEGKGIGLYLVQSQVTALGGSITVDSKEGEGTTFVIWFKKELFGKR
jgi:PAS domain S-box-containing protein